VVDDRKALIELACEAGDRIGFQRSALAYLDRTVGFAGAFYAGPRGDLVVSGFGPGYASTLTAGLPAYAFEIAPVKARALAQGGIAIDTQVLGRRAQATRYHDELVRPAGGGHSLLCFLSLRGQPQGMLMLARGLRTPFRPRDLERMRRLRSALALGLGSFATGPCPMVDLMLTARERAIADYVTRGFTNREIALAFGTSANTVRNQMVSLFRKAEVTTRAELVGRLLQQ
jgi:DNA-binding CsgD family transcriptional regulator